MTREPERTATAAELAAERAKLDRAATGAWRDVAENPPPSRDDDGCPAESGNWYCTLDAGHPGDHVAHASDDYVCHTWPQEAAPAWLPTEAELAEARLDRIRALTPEQCLAALIYLDGYEPQGVDYALASIAGRAGESDG